jgi:hypothetical protein
MRGKIQKLRQLKSRRTIYNELANEGFVVIGDGRIPREPKRDGEGNQTTGNESRDSVIPSDDKR